MKKFLLLILTFLSSVSLMAIGIKNGSTKDFIPDKSNVETSVCDEATVIFIDGYDCGEIYHNGWYKFDLTKLQDEEEIRILLTNPYGIGGETYSVLFYDSYDVTDPLLVLSGEMVNELSSIDTVIPKQVLEGINELYFHTTFSEEENISMNISPYIPCLQFDLPYYEWGTQKLMDASLTEFENAFYFVDIEGFYATPQRFNVGDLSSNQSVKLTVNNPSISKGVFAFISLNNDCSSQGCFIGRPGSIFAHRIGSGQTQSWILDFPHLFDGEQDAYFLPAITNEDGSFISGTWSLEIIDAIKTSTCADAIDFQSDVLYELLGNTNQYYTLNGALQDDITPLATEVTITNQSENEAEWICSVGYCGVEEIIAIEQLAAGETKTIQLEIPAFDTYYPEGGGNLYANITTTEDISMRFDVVNNSTTPSLEPCLNAIPISLGETVTAPANEERWYVLDITEVHEMQQEFRWIFTKLSDINAEINMSMYYDCEDALYYSPFFEIFSCSSQYIYVRAWSYKELTDFTPEYINSLYIHIAPTEDITMRFSLPAACEEDAIEIDWCNVQLSQLSTGWYKWNVADIHQNQEDVVFNVINDLMYPTTVTMDFYANCEDTEPINDFGGSQTYALGNNQQTMSYKRFVELFATGTDIFGESIETGFHNDVYIYISDIEQDYAPEPTLETHLIHYTSTNGKIVTPYKTDGFGANIISNTYKDGQGVITFDGPVTNIGQEAFSGSNITSIVIPESVQTIGASAFHSCYELTSISLPENLKNIDFATFAYCKKLPKISIPRNVTSIGPSAFYGCYVLDSLTIPENVTSIGEKAFYSCSSLKTIIWNAYKYENTIEKSPLYDIKDALRTIIFGDSMTHIPNHMCYNLKLNKIILPIGLESIGDMAFSGSNITSIIIPESVHTIGASAFHSCYELTSISLPENLKNIDFATFAYCSRLPKISIPHNVTSIGTSAFYGCPALTTLYANPTTPPSLGSSAFENSSLNTVYVPCGSANAYKSSSWNTYCTNFIEPEVLYSVNLHSADTIKGQVAFEQEPSCDNTAIIRAIPSSGYSFTTWNDGVTNNPRTLFLSQDTTFTANFELIILDAEYATICYGESYTWDKNGQTYTEAGTYTSITSEGEATLYLTVLPEVTITNDSATICYGETYSWNGHTYTESGDYVYTTTAANGCDSIVTLHLTINQTQYAEESIVACDSYTWNSETYTQSGEYVYTTTAANGCDSIVTLHLTINQTQYAEESIVACDSYEWNGETYTENGEYTYTTTAANGCDSIVTLHLTVNKTQYAEETIVACDSYEWNGKTYTESGEYTYTTTAANGCDSIVTLHLTINKSEVGAIEYATICYDETYTWNGQTYAVSGEYSVTLTNAAGCDSLAVLSITVLPEAIVDEQSISISENELPYTWHNQEINGSGVYTYAIPYTQTECDSAIYILNVEVETDTLENKCGDDLYWIYDTGNLTITGTGDMYDYTPTSMPWQTLNKEIRTILLPDEMSSIGAFAFTDCYYLPSINIPSSVVTINDGAFENCRLLSTISFANNGQLTTIGCWAFYNCHELKNVVIPEGVTKIGHAAFYGCTYLKDLTLPASLQSIADNGFAGCSKLAHIQVNAIIPPQVNARTFEEVDRSIPVIVPDESVEQYKSAPVWKEFNVRGKIGTGVENITTNENIQKILRDGQLLILRDDKTYNIVGQIVE